MKNQKLVSTIDDILTFMTLSDANYKYGKEHKFKMGYFSPCQIMYVEGLENSEKQLDENADEEDIDASITLKDLLSLNIYNELDISFMAGKASNGVKYQLDRYRLIGAKEKRGEYFSGFPAMEHALCLINEDGKFTTGKTIRVNMGSKWFRATGNNAHNKRYAEECTEWMQLIFGYMFRAHYKWTVTLGYPGFPHIKLDCTPLGAREIFRLRDVPEGKQRRAALHHWVNEHSRRKRKADSDEYIKVMDYLRGTTKFHWNGLNCEINPSPHDIERYAKLHNKQIAS